MNPSVLLIEDDEVSAELVSRLLWSDEVSAYDVVFDVTWVQYLRDGLQQMSSLRFDVVLLDLRLPDSRGLESLERIFSEHPDTALVVLTGVSDSATAMQAMRAGAQDYLNKHDLTSAQLCRSLLYAIERRDQRVTLRRLDAAQREMEAAGALQRMLLPKSAPSIPGFDIAGSYWPFDKVGGDYFDFFPKDGCLGLAIADVSGHGLASALVMAGLRRVMRSCMEVHNDVAETMTVANRAVWDDTHSERFVTAFLGRLDVNTRELTFCSAGHPAYLLSESGMSKTLECDNFPLGLIHDRQLTAGKPVTLQAGDLLVFFTDGLNEARNSNGHLWGIDALLQVVHQNRDKSADEIIAAVYQAVHAYCDPNPVGDDMAIIVMKSIADGRLADARV